MPSSLWLRLGGLLAVCLIPLGLYLLGQHDGGADERQAAAAASEKAQAEHLRRAIEQANEIARQDAEVLSSHEARTAAIRVVYRSLNQEASRYALIHSDDLPCGLDPDGLRLWTAANAGTVAAAPAAAAPYAAMPGVAAARIGFVDGTAGESHRGGAAVSTVSGATADAGGVGANGAGSAVRD